MKNSKNNTAVFESIAEVVHLPVDILMKAATLATTELVARGLSNKEAATIVGVEPEDVVEDLLTLGKFKGFVTNLGVSPIRLYLNANGYYPSFRQAFQEFNFSDAELEKLFGFLESYVQLRKELDEAYGIT